MKRCKRLLTNNGFYMNNKMDTIKSIAGMFCLVALFSVVLPKMAFAADDTISTVLCNVVQQLQGGIGKAIATIAIIVLGIGLFLGKFSWPVAVATAIGIGMIFGAAGIVDWVSSGTGGTDGDAAGACSKTT